ncbi:hypothetical protein BU23DRAFT_652557, partial [Bimuria novae-zelandiae CBS 107.79]
RFGKSDARSETRHPAKQEVATSSPVNHYLLTVIPHIRFPPKLQHTMHPLPALAAIKALRVKRPPSPLQQVPSKKLKLETTTDSNFSILGPAHCEELLSGCAVWREYQASEAYAQVLRERSGLSSSSSLHEEIPSVAWCSAEPPDRSCDEGDVEAAHALLCLERAVGENGGRLGSEQMTSTQAESEASIAALDRVSDGVPVIATREQTGYAYGVSQDAEPPSSPPGLEHIIIIHPVGDKGLPSTRFQLEVSIAASDRVPVIAARNKNGAGDAYGVFQAAKPPFSPPGLENIDTVYPVGGERSFLVRVDRPVLHADIETVVDTLGGIHGCTPAKATASGCNEQGGTGDTVPGAHSSAVGEDVKSAQDTAKG